MFCNVWQERSCVLLGKCIQLLNVGACLIYTKAAAIYGLGSLGNVLGPCTCQSIDHRALPPELPPRSLAAAVRFAQPVQMYVIFYVCLSQYTARTHIMRCGSCDCRSSYACFRMLWAPRPALSKYCWCTTAVARHTKELQLTLFGETNKDSQSK